MNINYCGYIQVVADYKKKIYQSAAWYNKRARFALLRSIYQ